jgi:two-component sensor histidine kinase
MAALVDLATAHTDLHPDAVDHLQRLVQWWGVLADFCFSDLLLYAPIAGTESQSFVILGHVRPNTSTTIYDEDPVGRLVSEGQRPLVARAWALEESVERRVITSTGQEITVQSIPVRFSGRTVAVLSRETAVAARAEGVLEREYLAIFSSLAQMVIDGTFPFAGDDAPVEGLPRVGDGVVALDATLRVRYASPKARSAFHRLGVGQLAAGATLVELGLDESAPASAASRRRPQLAEINGNSDTTADVWVTLRAIPLLADGAVKGLVVLVRDVSELRRRDRLLLSKDATIREIHHRVKNNLQTISALLRLQARRLSSRDAKEALEESVRRIRSIALVHETLSRAVDEHVDFDDITRPLIRAVEDGLASPDRRITFDVSGSAGTVPGEVATPLAVALTELLQNAADHGMVPGRALQVNVAFDRVGGDLMLRVSDDGAGLPAGFSLGGADGLGLTIVRALVVSELSGTLRLESEVGTTVELRVPIPERAALGR